MEAHNSPFAMHPGDTKMYQYLKQHFWWESMRRDVAEFVSKCLVCQKVKAPKQKAMDFIVGLPKTPKSYTVIWVVVDRLTKSAHFLPGKATYTVDN